MIPDGVIGINGKNVQTAMIHVVWDTEVAIEFTGGISYLLSSSLFCKLKWLTKITAKTRKSSCGQPPEYARCVTRKEVYAIQAGWHPYLAGVPSSRTWDRTLNWASDSTRGYPPERIWDQRLGYHPPPLWTDTRL